MRRCFVALWPCSMTLYLKVLGAAAGLCICPCRCRGHVRCHGCDRLRSRALNSGNPRVKTFSQIGMLRRCVRVSSLLHKPAAVRCLLRGSALNFPGPLRTMATMSAIPATRYDALTAPRKDGLTKVTSGSSVQAQTVSLLARCPEERPERDRVRELPYPSSLLVYAPATPRDML